jgi:hypothetical protein
VADLGNVREGGRFDRHAAAVLVRSAIRSGLDTEMARLVGASRESVNKAL